MEVLIRLSSAAALDSLEWVQVGSKIQLDAEWLVTASIPSERFVELTQHPAVVSLKLASTIQPANRD